MLELPESEESTGRSTIKWTWLPSDIPSIGKEKTGLPIHHSSAHHFTPQPQKPSITHCIRPEAIPVPSMHTKLASLTTLGELRVSILSESRPATSTSGAAMVYDELGYHPARPTSRQGMVRYIGEYSR